MSIQEEAFEAIAEAAPLSDLDTAVANFHAIDMARIEEKIFQDVARDAAVAKFRKAFAERSFSERNPELGKMRKCPYCSHRHRAAQIVECKLRIEERDALTPFISKEEVLQALNS